MYCRMTLVLLAATLWTIASPVFAEGNAAEGRDKAETCLGCHGVKGYFNVYPTYHVPKLGGQGAKYIESALKAYKQGTRQHATMHANAENLSEQDIADIATFLETYND